MRPREHAYPAIKDYGLVGDCGTAALVSRYGSVDWMCLPRFDSPSIFGALLDAEKGGHFTIHPAGDYRTERRYVDHTNVLETTFVTRSGVLQLTDLMPVADEEAYDTAFWPHHELLRIVSCDEGTVTVDVAFSPRLDYGRSEARLDDRGPLGIFCNFGAQVLVLRSERRLVCGDRGTAATGRFTLAAGERCVLSMAYDLDEPAVLPLLGDAAGQRLEGTLAYWRRWADRCAYDGPHHDAVIRSALALKLLTFSRSGAVVAAPTTSLPEHIGGSRNWDYRYCWLRDASFTLRVLFELGYAEEGHAFLAWLLNASGGTQPDLHVLYDVFGNGHLVERTLDHLEGYRCSQPVRVGNGAHAQLQLDIYGEVVSAAFEFVKRQEDRDGLTPEQGRLLRRLGDVVCERWEEPDEGIWEVRSGRRHHTYSKVMCWVALDRLLQLGEQGYVTVDTGRYRRVRDRIAETIERRGYDAVLGSYVSVFEGDDVDASLLLLPAYGYGEAGSERMRGTFAQVQRRLAQGCLVRRYRASVDDGVDGDEGAFGICSFWDAEYLARAGRLDEARDNFEATLGYANDLGLFSEEIDTETGDALGNFPQAFTHVGLINAALTIGEAEGRRSQSGLEERLAS